MSLPPNNSNWNDGRIPTGCRRVDFYRQSAPGEAWTIKLGTYIMESLTPVRSSKVVRFYDPIGKPQLAFGVSDFVEATAVIQLATFIGDGSRATTIPIRDGDAFSTILDPSAPSLAGAPGNEESFVVTKADAPEAALGYKTQGLSLLKIGLASKPATPVPNFQPLPFFIDEDFLVDPDGNFVVDPDANNIGLLIPG